MSDSISARRDGEQRLPDKSDVQGSTISQIVSRGIHSLGGDFSSDSNEDDVRASSVSGERGDSPVDVEMAAWVEPISRSRDNAIGKIAPQAIATNATRSAASIEPRNEHFHLKRRPRGIAMKIMKIQSVLGVIVVGIGIFTSTKPYTLFDKELFEYIGVAVSLYGGSMIILSYFAHSLIILDHINSKYPRIYFCINDETMFCRERGEYSRRFFKA